MKQYTLDDLRRPSTITRIERGKEDHGIETVWLFLEGGGWCQGFGGLCMKDPAESALYLSEVCAIFGIADAERLKGQAVIALYSDSSWGSIEGIECPSTGKRFTVRGWRLRRGYKAPTPTEAKRDRLLSSIASHESRLAKDIAELAQLPELIDWETQS